MTAYPDNIVTGNILLIEPFYGGSHKQLMDTLVEGFQNGETYLATLPANKWHWRARTGAVTLSQTIPRNHKFSVVFTSSVLNLAELVALRPDIGLLKKVVYFHENQLIYPVRKPKDRDFQYGYNEILTCLVADTVIFNSQFNCNSFLDNIDKFFKLQPNCRPQHLREDIMPKCRVLYFPVKFPPTPPAVRSGPLHIVWPHRWEHDKGPDLFLRVLLSLHATGLPFVVSLLGQSYSEVDTRFSEVRSTLGSRVLHWGPLQDREDYLAVLGCAHVSVSTAQHEFYGVAMLEATHCGCFPLCPDALVYPEIYPPCCLYGSEKQLEERLREFCEAPLMAVEMRRHLDLQLSCHSSEHLLPQFQELLSSGCP